MIRRTRFRLLNDAWDKSIAQVAKELGLAYNTLHRWVKEYKESNGKSFVGSGNIKRKIKKSSNYAAAIKS